MKILVTGIPGVGKTSLSKKLSESIGIEHIELTKFIKENKLYEEYDSKFDTLIFDEDNVYKYLEKYVKDKDSFILDTHSPIIAEGIDFDHIFHLVCDNGIIYDRLAKRGYSKVKIDENIESAIFDIISEELEDLFQIEAIKVNSSSIPIDNVDLTVENVMNMFKK